MAKLSRQTIAKYLQAAKSAKTTKARGTAFESLLMYVLGRIPGVSDMTRDALNELKSEEVDIAFFNGRHPKGLHYLPHFILAECKNWSRPTGSEEISWFDTKLRDRGLSFGIFFSASGITGDRRGKTASYDIVSKALREGRQIIVLTEAELLPISDTDEFNTLIKTKVCNLIASGSI